MTEAPDASEPDEAFEALASLRLVFRCYGLSVLAGALWYLPTASTVIGGVASVAACLLAFYAWMPLVPASLALRNSLCRQLGLKPPPGVVTALGIVIFGLLLGLAAAVFGLMGQLYALA